MASEIKDAIVDNATGPRKVDGDEASVEQHNLRDQIAADKHVASSDGVAKKHRGIRMTKLISPGTV